MSNRNFKSSAGAVLDSGCRALDCDEMVSRMRRLAKTIDTHYWVRSTAAVDALLEILHRLRIDLADHIAMMEGPGGMVECVGEDCPRLTPQIRRLCREHQCIRSCLAEIESLLDQFRRGRCDADAVLEQSACLMKAMADHQDTGNHLLLEAYATDIGTGD